MRRLSRRPIPPIRGGEDPDEVLIIDAHFEEGQLLATNEVVRIPEKAVLPRLLLSPETTPDAYVPIGGGVAHAYTGPDGDVLEKATVPDSRIDSLGGGRYRWVYPVKLPRLLIILLLPDQCTAHEYLPVPAGAKAFQGRVVLYWRFLLEDQVADIVWGVAPSSGNARADVERVNADIVQMGRDGDRLPTVLAQFLTSMQANNLAVHVGELTMGDRYDIRGQVGAAGRDAKASDMKFEQTQGGIDGLVGHDRDPRASNKLFEPTQPEGDEPDA